MENEIIVGLDIGTTKIACFIGMKADEGRVKILGFGKSDSAGVEHGTVINILDAASSIRKAVNQASDQANVDVDEVWVGIAGQHIKSRPSQGSITIPDDHHLITQEDVDNLVKEQYRQMLEPGEEIIHIFPQDFTVDREQLSREISPVGVAGKTLSANFHMVTGNAQAVQNIRDAVRMAGLTIKGVALEPVASSMAVLSDADRDAGVVLVDIGGGTTDIAIFYDGIIRHTSVLPMAGHSITKDIREGCNILKDQAERLKVKFGSCLPRLINDKDVVAIPGIRSQAPKEIYMRTLAEIINVRTKIILEQVAYEIQLSGFEKKLIAGIALTGGGSKLKHIDQLCALITATDTRIGTPDEHLSPDSVAADEIAHPMYATGIGLVMFGLNKSAEDHQADEQLFNNLDDKKKDKKNDIFDDLPPVPPAPEQPEKEPEKPKKQERSRSRNLGNSIQSWLDKFISKDLTDE